ncbi:MAG: TetR/AcrR family transcriptional regulator [Desulfobacteraceae bacterium]|nr:TetR/AcrR family transcriptional regulator [Desulfobacteraceae bacterium]
MPDRQTQTKKTEVYRRIVRAATRDFSQKGYAGARMDEIAGRAKVNKATIYYHIGDKKALYAQVLHDVFGAVADRMAECIHDDHTPEENLKQYVLTLADTISNNPFIPPIMMREAASGGKNLPILAIKDFGRMFSTLAGILDSGHQRGVFRKVDPIVVHLSALGPLVLYSRMEKTFRRYARDPEVVPQEIRLPENIVETVLESISNIVKLKKD